MDQYQVWRASAFDKVANAISPFFLRSGIYLFLISFICLFYLLNAPLLLGHYDLGWHLAAGDLIRDSNAIPPQDPWSFTHGDKPMVQSVLALGRACQCDVSIRGLWRPRRADGGLWRGDRRHPDCDLSWLRRVGDRGLRLGLLCLPALSRLRSFAEHVSRGLAEYMHDVVLRRLLPRVPETNAMVRASRVDGALGQSARWLSARLLRDRRVLRRGLAQSGLV
ncbi:hypothetical protein ACVWWG_003133 [Bradyrhizobium sp. LB7.2]